MRTNLLHNGMDDSSHCFSQVHLSFAEAIFASKDAPYGAMSQPTAALECLAGEADGHLHVLYSSSHPIYKRLLCCKAALHADEAGVLEQIQVCTDTSTLRARYAAHRQALKVASGDFTGEGEEAAHGPAIYSQRQRVLSVAHGVCLQCEPAYRQAGSNYEMRFGARTHLSLPCEPTPCL